MGPDKKRVAKLGQAGRPLGVDSRNKIEAGQDKAKAGDENAERGENDLTIGIGTTVGGVKRSTRITTTADNGSQGE